MSLIPRDKSAKVRYFQAKTGPWAASAAQIGTTAEAVGALADKVATAQAKVAAARALREQAKAATADADLAIRDMAVAGADIIKQVRARAATDGPGVYVLAQVPAPAAPSPLPPPGKPTDFKAALNADGSLRLTWACKNPAGSSGTMYQVSRRAGIEGEFVALGTSGTKSFVDSTLPAGVAGVTYEVRAVRSTATGLAAHFPVNFGVAAGRPTASVAVGQGGAKLAA